MKVFYGWLVVFITVLGVTCFHAPYKQPIFSRLHISTQEVDMYEAIKQKARGALSGESTPKQMAAMMSAFLDEYAEYAFHLPLNLVFASLLSFLFSHL